MTRADIIQSVEESKGNKEKFNELCKTYGADEVYRALFTETLPTDPKRITQELDQFWEQYSKLPHDTNPSQHFINRNMTALHLAATYGCNGLIEYWLSKNKDLSLDIQTKITGQTALHLAALSGHPEIVTLLLKAGANAELLSRDGSNVLHSAQGNDDVINALKDSLTSPDKENPSSVKNAREILSKLSKVENNRGETPRYNEAKYFSHKKDTDAAMVRKTQSQRLIMSTPKDNPGMMGRSSSTSDLPSLSRPAVKVF